MVRNEFTFPSADGRTGIHAVEWTPDMAPRAVLVLSHGVSEHILRYEPLAAYLTEWGFAVAGHDHLGHGLSVAAGAPRLYFGPRGSWDWAVQDLYARRELAGQRFPGLPVFLLGHSMGSFLARTYLIRYPGTVAGAILMGTGQMPPALVAAGRVLAAREARKVGDRHSSPLVNKLAFEAYNQKFAPNRTGYDWLSASTENVDQYLADPLCGGDPTIGLFREMLRGIACIEKQENLKRMNRNTPVLFLSGQDDPVGDMGKGVRRAYRSFRRSGVRACGMRSSRRRAGRRSMRTWRTGWRPTCRNSDRPDAKGSRAWTFPHARLLTQPADFPETALRDLLPGAAAGGRPLCRR